MKCFFCVPVYKMAQHLSSIGLILIFLFAISRITSRMLKLILKYWWTTFGFSAVVFWDKISFGVPLSEIGSVIVSILFL
jgi:hypothetical protein